jgi:hypothetical protein
MLRSREQSASAWTQGQVEEEMASLRVLLDRLFEQVCMSHKAYMYVT